MNATRKVVLLILLGAGACLLSFTLSQYFSQKNHANRQLLAQIQQLSGRVAYIRLLSKSFIQNADQAGWAAIIHHLDAIRFDPAETSPAEGVRQQAIADLQRRLADYRGVLGQIHDPALRLMQEKKGLQTLGRSFADEVDARIVGPYSGEEGLRVYRGDPIDPIKTRIKEAAQDLIGLHLQQQLLLLQLILDWDLEGYQSKHQEMSRALETHKAQLRYLNVLMGDTPHAQTIIDAIDGKLGDLMALEQSLIDRFATLIRLNARLTEAGDGLLEASQALSALLVSDTMQADRLNQTLNWALLVTILIGLGVVGALLAADIIRFVDALQSSRDDLKASERRLKEITANLPGVVYQFQRTPDHVYTTPFVSEKASELFALDSDSKDLFDQFLAHIPDDERARFMASVQDAVDREVSWDYEGRFNKPGDGEIWFSGHADPHRSGDALVFYGVLMDVTRRKKLEASLRLTQFCLEKASIGIFRVGDEGRILDANEQACRSLGYSSDALCRMTVFDIDPNVNPRIWPEHIDRLRKEKFRRIESLHRRKDGTLFPVQILINIMTFENQEFHVAFVQDITERKKWENDRAASERRYRKLFNEAPVMYVITRNRAGEPCIEDVNNLFLETLGYDRQEVLGSSLADYYTPASSHRLMDEGGYQRALAGSFLAEERDLITRDGRIVHTVLHALPELDADGRVVGTRAMYLDITASKQAELEAKRLEAALVRSQKMEALGTLSGGIAHDFNNILSAVVGYTQLSLSELDETSHLHHNLQQIFAAAMRAGDLVRQILAFSRQAKQELTPLQVGPLVKETLKLLRSTLPVTIDITPDVDRQTDAILADPTQIHQIVMNLCTNAAQAMEKTGGRLRVAMAQVQLSPGDLPQCPSLEAGDYVRLTVQDSGHGIPPEIRELIFDPYFTTKESGKGTGLGLSVVHGIVESYSGGIAVESVPDQGTTVDVYFPVIRDSAPQRPKRAHRMPTGSETILLVDDEPALVEVGQLSLQRLGYTVRAFTDSLEALAHVERAPDGIDLLISDLTMPKMTGDTLAVRMRRIRPDLPVILCTGFSSTFTDREAADLGIDALVDKPLAMEKLASVVRRVLDRTTEPRNERRNE